MIDTGFGKGAAFLDVDSPGDVGRYKDMAANCDLVVQSLRPGVLQRRGPGVRGTRNSCDMSIAPPVNIYATIIIAYYMTQ